MSAVTVGGFSSYSSQARQVPARQVPARQDPARQAPARQVHLRMTKRGRTVLLTLVATPVVVTALAFGINAGGAVGTSSSTPLSKITVVGGETLWSVAKQIAPTADPRDVVADIMSVNRLSSADIYPGERLSIPAQYDH